MIYYTSTHADVAESFLLGLSCLVGGDQFYIFISKTDASPKTQSYIAITAVLATLFLAFVFYDEYNRSLFDVTHVLYLVLLVIWGLILYQNVRNPFVTTYYISILSMVMSFLVIISCVHYSHQKELLPSFLSGMLFARLLPTLLWIFVHQKKAESKSNLSSLSARLAFFRLVFGIISMILKFTSGNLDFSLIKMDTVEKYDLKVIRSYAFKNLAKHFTNIPRYFRDMVDSFFTSTKTFSYLFKHFAEPSYNNYSIVYLILLTTTVFFLFFSSLILYLGFPPILHQLSHLYSHHLYYTIDIMKTLSHLLGVALATKYPPSKTTNSYYFGAICLACLVYIYGLENVNNCTFGSHLLLYTFVNLTGTILGYIWSYSLGIIKNIFFVKTCIYEEKTTASCCGDKTESQCYCRLEYISKSLNQGNSETKLFECSKLCSNAGKRFRYSKDGNCAILLILNSDDKTSTQTCQDCCNSQCDGQCCLKIIGKYKLESVTVSSCEDCQLTIRLEGTCCNSEQCPSCNSNGQQCTCGQGTGNKCCLCLKCCQQGSSSCECKCCIHLCNKSGCSCSCKNTDAQGVRVFICFKNGTKCCIREIRPNSSKEFTDDLKIQNEFDVKVVSFFDCCHVNLTVDLQCTMKNNFFRIGPINYPKKTIRPYSLTLMRSGNECCKAAASKCCCKNIDFVKLCVIYDESEQNCEIKCDCKGKTCCCPGDTSSQCPCCTCKDGTCCCCLTCELAVNRLTSYYNRIEAVRVKLVLILWSFFLIFLMIAISISSKIINNKLKYYQFFPDLSFETVNKELESNGMNSMNQVLERLRTTQQSIFLQLFGEKDKKTDLDHMFQLCKCAFDPCSLNTLRHYVLSKSSMLIASPHYLNRRLNLELVKWSYCVGFVYTYIMLMFFNIQEYFLKWERVWRMEYLNYKRIMSGKFNNLTRTSKSSMSLICEKSVDHRTILYSDTSKKGGWGCSHDELDIHANLNERETEMSKDPPYILDMRLMFFLDKWKHRVENLIFWTENETNVYDWTGFLKEYSRIRTWFFKFLPHIQMASHEMNIPTEKLNIGSEILQNKPLDLIS